MTDLVPVLDMERVTPAELIDALTASSCVFLRGHGLAPDALAALLATARAFYALPESEKAAVQWPGEGPWRGWQPVYAGGPQALLLERLEVALAPGRRGLPAPEWAASFELWPEHPAELRSAWTSAYATLHDLASRLTVMIATGLDLPAEDLPAWTTWQHSNLVVNHYLPQDSPPEAGRVRQRAHSDIGGLTLLWADATPGLEARIGSGGTWVPIRFPEDALLLQAGDLLHLWSGGRIPANEHRVVNPTHDGRPQPARYSVAFFHHPDLETWVAPPVPDAVGVDALDHVLWRQRTSATQDAGG